MKGLLAYARTVERVLAFVGAAAGWLFIVNALIIGIDVVTRRFGFQFPGLGSTRLQELEWHLHMVLFMLWIGLAYIRNVHVRIDLVVGNLGPRTRAFIELFGLLLLALPYCLVLLYHGWEFAWRAWVTGESSESITGLPWRWLPKAIMEFGFLLLLLAITAVLARLIVYLFGPAALRDQARPAQVPG